MKFKKTTPLYQIGQTVNVAIVGDWEQRKITDLKWNGMTWMYSFEDTNMSCGEMYLAKVKGTQS
jgi:hypothetical protein